MGVPPRLAYTRGVRSWRDVLAPQINAAGPNGPALCGEHIVRKMLACIISGGYEGNARQQSSKN